MTLIKSVLVVPVLSRTKSYLFSKFPDLVKEDRFFDLSKSKKLYGLSSTLNLLTDAKLERYVSNEKSPIKINLELILPQKYMQYGLVNIDAKRLGRVLDQMVTSELIIFAQNLSSLPLMSRANSIRITLDFFGISQDEYDMEAFRRLIDRYTPRAMGTDFFQYRSRLTAFIIKFYLESLDIHAKNPEWIKSRIENLKTTTRNEFGQFDRM